MKAMINYKRQAYDLSDKVVIPFFTYGATTYLNESMQTIYRAPPTRNTCLPRCPKTSTRTTSASRRATTQA